MRLKTDGTYNPCDVCPYLMPLAGHQATGNPAAMEFQFGNDDDGVDVYFYGATASHRVYWDETNDTWYFGQDDHGIPVVFYGETSGQVVNWDEANGTWEFGKNGVGVDVYFYGETSGSYALWDETNDKLVMNVAKLEFTGTPTTNLIKAGSYGSMLTHPGSSLISMGAEGASDGWYIGQGLYVRASGEDGKPFGYTTTVEITTTDGTDRGQAGQFIIGLGSIGSGGNEAAVLKTLGGDATAGMYATWHKIGGGTNAVVNSGGRMAAIWLDNQFSGTCNGEEYTIFSTTGGSVPDAWASFETTSSGWAALFHFDSTLTGSTVAPLSSKKPDTSTTNADGSLIIDLNGTKYYIPYYTSGHCS